MIRSATSQDAQAIVKIYNHYIQHTIISFECEPITAVAMQNRIANINALDLPFLVAQEQDTIIGYCYAGPWKARHAYRHTVEVSVYLHQGIVKKGWGTQLYHALFSELKARPVHTAIAIVAVPNPASTALHQKMGMEKVAHLKKIGYKFNQHIDTEYWQKILHVENSKINSND